MGTKGSAGARAALITLTCLVLAGCAIDVEEDVEKADAVAAVVSLPGVVVVASRPTISEILDIILRDRPTAA